MTKSHYPNPFLFTSLTRSTMSNWTCGSMTHFADLSNWSKALTHLYSQITICQRTRNLDVKTIPRDYGLNENKNDH